MPVTVESGVTGPFTPNGSAAAFAFQFKADSVDEVSVVDEDGTALSSALYSVALNDNEGGTVTFASAPLLADYAALFIVSAPAMTQGSDFGNTGPSFNPASLTRALDRAAIRDLKLQADLDRTIKVPFGEASAVLPSNRNGLFLSFDAGGLPVASTGTGADAGLRADLAASGGAELAGVLQSGTGAIVRTVAAKAKDHFNLRDYVNPASDASQGLQYALNEASVLTIPAAAWTLSWAAISADINIPANRKIIVEKGAVITNTGGRFTAENVDNVEWQIDGWLKSAAMRAAASKPLWTGSVDERGFIEFADIYTVGQASSGFKVHGSGKVSGDWTGTPNVSALATQINKKGIACWNAKNVLVSGLEIYGFDGEAVYASFFDAASKNIVFELNNVHDTRFNALNFNAGANGGGCFIRNNTAKDAYAIEISAGSAIGNTVDGMVYCGIWTGAGAGYGPVNISRNEISNSGLHGIAAIYGSGTPVTDVTIDDNTINASEQYSVYTDYIREFSIQGNKCSGSGTGAGAYDIGVNHSLRGKVENNTFTSPGASAQVGRVSIDANSFDVEQGNNRYIPTTGMARAFTSTEDIREFGPIARTLANGEEIILPTLQAGQLMKLELMSPLGIGFYTVTSGAPSLLAASDAGYGVGGAGTVNVAVSTPAGTHKVVNTSAGNSFPFIVKGIIAG